MFIKEKLYYYSKYGLGDKIVDIFGFIMLCKYLKYTPIVIMNNNKYNFVWGSCYYDIKLFNFEKMNIIIFNELATKISNKNELLIHDTGNSLLPYNLFLFLKIKCCLDFNSLLKEYLHVSKQLLPSNIIEKDIPTNLENVYGIHLRKSDKISINPNVTNENTIHQFDIITNQLIIDLTEIILTEHNPSFLLVSEDNEWKKEFHNRLLEIAEQNSKLINIVQINYDPLNQLQGYASVLDMFCLSRCKRIYQGVKYSTFSLLSALIGNVPVINYSHLLDDYDSCMINNWKELLNINDGKYFKNNIFDIKCNHDIKINYNLQNIII